jgi:diphthamide biosynthesis methyltransferase
VTMLYLLGLGLADETDITVKGLEVVKRAERVYLEAYTSILLVDKSKLVSYPILSQLILTLTVIGSILWQRGYHCRP